MIIVVSDIHLGTDHLDAINPDREGFKDFLRYLKNDRRPDHLVLNGDIEDFWRRDMRTLTRENYDVFALLAELQESGVEVHYIRGNHDWYARKDSTVEGARDNTRREYYVSNYPAELKLTTHGTSYTFKHGHQFDSVQKEWYFDLLALISDDAMGATISDIWAVLIGTKGMLRGSVEMVNLLRDRIGTQLFGPLAAPLSERIARMDRCGHEHDLGVVPSESRTYIEDSFETDWLCIGHTHHAGIDSGLTVANSGAWLDRRDTYLRLEAEPQLMDWNEGNPEPITDNPGR